MCERVRQSHIRAERGIFMKFKIRFSFDRFSVGPHAGCVGVWPSGWPTFPPKVRLYSITGARWAAGVGGLGERLCKAAVDWSWITAHLRPCGSCSSPLLDSGQYPIGSKHQPRYKTVAVPRGPSFDEAMHVRSVHQDTRLTAGLPEQVYTRWGS